MDHAKLTPQPTRGQSAIEFALALVATLTLLYGSVRVFAWVNSGFVQREVSYQQSRMTAGAIQTAGTPNPYQMPELKMFLPSVTPPVRPPRTSPGNGTCPAADALINQANALTDEADRLMAGPPSVQDEAARVEQLANDAQRLLDEAQQLRAEANELDAMADELERQAFDQEAMQNYVEAQRLRDEAQALRNEANQKRMLADQKEAQSRQKAQDAAAGSQQLSPRTQEANAKYAEAQCLYRIAGEQQTACDGRRDPNAGPIDDPATCRPVPEPVPIEP